MEIERKFLVKTCPPHLSSYPSKHLIQGYLNQEPVIRIRQEDDSYFLTYKSKGLLKREEINMPLTKEAFLHLKSKVDGPLIEKTRYFIPLTSSLIAELDVFENFLDGLLTVEVEFKSEEEAMAFIPPSWFGEEVTYNPSFQNNSLVKIQSKEAFLQLLGKES